jgi:hypothetical protein
MVTLPVFHYFILFIKNPCTPANPEMRIEVEILDKKELFFYVLFLTFFMQDLFANGFGPQ